MEAGGRVNDNGSAVSLIIARYELLMLTYNVCQSGYGLFGIRSFFVSLVKNTLEGPD